MAICRASLSHLLVNNMRIFIRALQWIYESKLANNNFVIGVTKTTLCNLVAFYNSGKSQKYKKIHFKYTSNTLPDTIIEALCIFSIKTLSIKTTTNAILNLVRITEVVQYSIVLLYWCTINHFRKSLLKCNTYALQLHIFWSI